MAGDLDQLVDMGFDREKAALALQKGGNLTGAIDWLDNNADRSIDELKAEEEASVDVSTTEATANSYKCNDCGKLFRGMAQAQYHAEKSGHDDFSESTEEMAPLTEDEKAARLAELRAKLAEKRASQAAQDKVEQKRNEEIRRKHTKENDDAKEELQRKQQIKEAQQKRQEKLDEAAAKQRIRDKIEADKAERRRKAEEEKAMRANPEAFNPGAPTAAGTGLSSALTGGQPRPTVNHSEARLRLQTPSGNVMKTFAADTTLFEVAQALAQENGTEATSFTQNFPKKVYDQVDFGLTLKEAGLVPSAALIVR